MKCKYSEECVYYDEEGIVCNKEENREYCGMYRRIELLKDRVKFNRKVIR